MKHFDIFERRPDGSPNWVASVETLEGAKEMVNQLASSNGHFDYFVYDFKVGKNVWVWPNRPEAEPDQR
jgi:hypothetical protein